MVISTPEEKSVFETLLWDAEERMGITVKFFVQDYPRGIADAFNVVKRNMPDAQNQFDRFALVLGDNIFYGAGLTEMLTEALRLYVPAIFVTKVKDPERFGVACLNWKGQVIDIEEKPEQPKSDLAVTGLYFFDRYVFERVEELKPSRRGELEITDLIKTYLPDVQAIKLLRGMIWFDTGTADALLEASNHIAGIQKHQGFMVGNPHEVAYNKGWIDKQSLRLTAQLCEKSAYGKYLLELME